MTSSEAARATGLSRCMILRYCKSGALRATKPGRDWQITAEDLEEFKRKPRKRGAPKRAFDK